jgi:hypothetical protein
MKFFNKSGPVNCEDHYCLNPLERFDLDHILSLIEQKKYFIMHAPRQTGKTSTLLALMKHLNDSGKYKCLYFNVEPAQAAREDVSRGIRTILGEMVSRSQYYLQDDFLAGIWLDILNEWGPEGALNECLTRWTNKNEKPIVLLIDEIDSLVGDTLISVLRQLRAGYDKRPKQFPNTVVLCGVRDVRDYRMHHDKLKEIITGGSAFNIKDESLRLGDFSQEDVGKLFLCHTEETGQKFTPESIHMVWELTQGQPWLVNALAYEVTFKMKENRDRSIVINEEHIIRAKENIILRRETHIDQLMDKLQEERVQRVIEPMLAGKTLVTSFKTDDVGYLLDLGLIRQKTNGEISLANRIYQEVIPRELGWNIQSGMSIKSAWYINENGMLNMEKLLLSFQDFFRTHSEHWLQIYQYKEAGPQLLMQAFLQRIVNSGGRVEREYGLGRKRVDLFVLWKYREKIQKIVIELKLLYSSLEKTMAEGLEQTNAYMDKCGTDEGHLVIFDRTPERTWEEKIFRREAVYQGKTIAVWGM